MKLHILNGEVMMEYFKRTKFLDEEMVPFNEAMCYGETSETIFTEQFIQVRANVHHVTTDQYYQLTIKLLEKVLNNEYNELYLWFDEDMFCQINVLTILAWLDQNNNSQSVILNIVDHGVILQER